MTSPAIIAAPMGRREVRPRGISAGPQGGKVLHAHLCERAHGPAADRARRAGLARPPMRLGDINYVSSS